MSKKAVFVFALVSLLSVSCKNKKADEISFPSQYDLKKIERITIEECKNIERTKKVHYLIIDGESDIPGAITFNETKTIADLNNFKNDIIVTSCDCPKEVSAAVVAFNLKNKGYKNVYALSGGTRSLVKFKRNINANKVI